MGARSGDGGDAGRAGGCGRKKEASKYFLSKMK